MEQKNSIPVVVVIPSLNPDNNLIRTIEGIQNSKNGAMDIILVNDGSRDECKEIFDLLSQKGNLIVLHHKKNKGKGAALKTAFDYYLKNYNLSTYRGIVTADADGQHLPEDIYSTAERMCNEIMLENDRVLVLGTRNFNDPIVPFKSKNGNKITTILFQILYGKRVNDTQTGLRGISNEYVKECLALPGERFEYEIHMLIDAVVSKVKIVEEIIATVYLNQNRETHFNPVKDSFRIYKVMFGMCGKVGK